MIQIKLEPAEALFEEIRPLLEAHWEEIALDKAEIKLDPDWDKYAELARNGSLRVITVRDVGELVGYAAFFIVPHMHYRTSLTALSDIFFLRKEYRLGATGLKLFRVAEEELAKLGVQKLYVTHKTHLDVGVIFRRLKYNLIEHTYSKLLRRD